LDLTSTENLEMDDTSSASVVRLRPGNLPSLSETATRRIECRTESWQGEPSIFMTDCPGAANDLALASERVARDMAPARPDHILLLLTELASRLNLELPSEFALRTDIRIMASWPVDLFEKSLAKVWETWEYRRFPACGDFLVFIEDDLNERRKRRACLSEAELKLQTIKLRAIWDAESRERRRRPTPEKGSAAV
jgi:hypothetical protein